MTSYDDSNWQNLPEHYRLKLDNVGSTTITELMPGETMTLSITVRSRWPKADFIRFTFTT